MRGRQVGKSITSLHDMDYDEVSTVDVPAGQFASIMIAKRHQGDDMAPKADTDEIEYFFADGTAVSDESELETGDVVLDADGVGYVYTAPDDREDESAGRELVGAGASVEKSAGNALLAIQRGPAKVAKNAAKVAKSAATEDLATQISKALEAASSDADRDEVIKSFAGLVQKQQDRLELVEKAAAHERDLRLEGQYVEVAKGLGLPGDPGELGPVLKRMADVMSDADIAVIAKTLEATSGVLYEEFGYDGVGVATGDPAMADAEAAAEQKINKVSKGVDGLVKISKAEAIEEYYSENPDAYDEYMANRAG